MWIRAIIVLIASYLLGNLNGSVVMSGLFAHEDVRARGSGNAGLTNFVRNYGTVSAIGVVLIDVGKAAAACLLGRFLLQSYGYGMEGMAVGAIGVSLGHDFPVFLGFRGGKGILCGATIGFFVDWRCGVLLLAVFGVTYLLTEYVSLGSVLASLALILYMVLCYRSHPVAMVLIGFLGLLAIFMHRANLQRLRKGTEPKTKLRKRV